MALKLLIDEKEDIVLDFAGRDPAKDLRNELSAVASEGRFLFTGSDEGRGAEAFLDRPDRPDAAFCLYERLAAEVVVAAAQRGIRVPEDLLVVTIAEVGLAASADPPITTLEISQQTLGERAVDLLVEAVAGGAPRSVLDVPTRIVRRASTARRRGGGRRS